MNLEILEELIKEGESLSPTITYVPSGPNVIRTYSVYKTSEPERYQNWQSSTQRFVKSFHASDVEEVKEASKKLSPDNHRKILGVLRAIKLLPNEPAKEVNNRSGWTNNIHIANNQNNTQLLTLNLFLDAIKDELTGKDFRAIKEIMQDYEKEPEKTKTKLIEKVKGFGGDVLSNIVANILTNPTIYNRLF
jgi:hypothetical protein